MSIITLEHRADSTIETLTELWKDSVIASHTFLDSSDINQIKKIIPDALRQISSLSVINGADGSIQGFIGIDNRKIEMLFIRPSCTGKGFGSRLIDFAITHYNVNKVDVNEDNTNALAFYTSKGFGIISRSDLDDQGNPFPILHLELISQKKI